MPAALLAIFAMATVGANNDLGTIESYHQGLNMTVLEANLGRVITNEASRVNLTVALTYSGKGRSKASEKAIIHFLAYTEGKGRYGDEPELVLNIDGAKREQRAACQTSMRGDLVLERITASVAIAELTSLANGKLSEGNLGSDPFRLSASQRALLKEFVGYASDPKLVVKKGVDETRLGFNALVKGAGKEVAETADATATPDAVPPGGASEAQSRGKAPIPPKKGDVSKRAETKLKMAAGLEKAKRPLSAIEYYEAIVKEFPGSSQAKTATERLKVLKPAKRDSANRP